MCSVRALILRMKLQQKNPKLDVIMENFGFLWWTSWAASLWARWSHQMQLVSQLERITTNQSDRSTCKNMSFPFEGKTETASRYCYNIRSATGYSKFLWYSIIKFVSCGVVVASLAIIKCRWQSRPHSHLQSSKQPKPWPHYSCTRLVMNLDRGSL